MILDGGHHSYWCNSLCHRHHQTVPRSLMEDLVFHGTNSSESSLIISGRIYIKRKYKIFKKLFYFYNRKPSCSGETVIRVWRCMRSCQKKCRFWYWNLEWCSRPREGSSALLHSTSGSTSLSPGCIYPHCYQTCDPWGDEQGLGMLLHDMGQLWKTQSTSASVPG